MGKETDFTIKPSTKIRTMHPQKFAMWLFIVTVVMIFVALTSAYIVKKGAGDWKYIELPSAFVYSSIIIVISSISMHWAYLSAKRDNIFNVRLAVVLTGLFAMGFVFAQWTAWDQLLEQGAYFVGNPSGSFIYVFTGLHVAHLVGGIVFLLIVLISAFKFQVHSKRLSRIEMCATYWHFLGGLWLYLYIFLIINN
jgi:cytochrome c oxidase subunit 3